MIDKIIERLEREKLIAFETLANTGDEKFDFAYLKVGNYADKAIDIIKQVIKENNNGWIMCSDRLPNQEECFENENEFLLTIKLKYTDKIISTSGFYNDEYKCFETEDNIYLNTIAWRKLPEPFKECD